MRHLYSLIDDVICQEIGTHEKGNFERVIKC